jgi:hypothetical protein
MRADKSSLIPVQELVFIVRTKIQFRGSIFDNFTVTCHCIHIPIP